MENYITVQMCDANVLLCLLFYSKWKCLFFNFC